jgi:hypothetical protein
MGKEDKGNGKKKVRRESAMTRALDITTIVGGRPRGEKDLVSKEFAMGLDLVITRAALSPKFREDLLGDPVGACGRHGIALKDSERQILAMLPRAELERTIDGVFGPAPSRRKFIKSVAASIVAFVAGEAVWLYAGCGGASPYYPSDYSVDTDVTQDEPAVAHDLWVSLNGMNCYLHVPASYAGAAQMPLVVAFHGAGETCLEMMERMVLQSDGYGYLALAVNWSGSLDDAATLDAIALADSLAADYGYRVETAARFIAGHLEGSVLALTRGLYEEAGWAGAAGFFGLPAESYRSVTPGSSVAKVHISMASSQPDYAQTEAYGAFLTSSGLGVHVELVDGSPDLTATRFTQGVLYIME